MTKYYVQDSAREEPYIEFNGNKIFVEYETLGYETQSGACISYPSAEIAKSKDSGEFGTYVWTTFVTLDGTRLPVEQEFQGFQAFGATQTFLSKDDADAAGFTNNGGTHTWIPYVEVPFCYE